jgi:hypothetical protein
MFDKFLISISLGKFAHISFLVVESSSSVRLISAFAHKPLILLLGVLGALLACKNSVNSNGACCFSCGKVLMATINVF